MDIGERSQQLLSAIQSLAQKLSRAQSMTEKAKEFQIFGNDWKITTKEHEKSFDVM